jgi:hypothetical protein
LLSKLTDLYEIISNPYKDLSFFFDDQISNFGIRVYESTQSLSQNGFHSKEKKGFSFFPPASQCNLTASRGPMVELQLVSPVMTLIFHPGKTLGKGFL